jgi:cell division protein FtsZ
MSQDLREHGSETTTRDVLAIKIFGVGGAGGQAVNYLASTPIPGVTLIAVNTDAQALAACAVPHQLQLGAKLLRGLGTGGEPELGWAAAEKDAEALRQHCVGADVILVITGLGGGTGTGASPVLARVAKESGALVLAFAILPFECEGVRRQQQAQQGLEQLRHSADGVICLPNQRLFKLLDGHTSAVDTFKYASQLLRQAVYCLWRLLTRPALIRVDVSDLRQLLQTSVGASVFAAASGQGINRVGEAIEGVLASPLLEGGKTFHQAKAALLSIVGGPDLTMTEVNGIVEKISRYGDNLQIFMGAAIDESLAERLEIALFLFCDEPVRIQQNEPAHVKLALPKDQLQPPMERVPDAPTDPHREAPVRPSARLVPPAPALTQERAETIMRRQTGSSSRSRKMANQMKQGQLPLDIVSKGRFEKSEPTIHKGEDLDLPTFIRKRVPLN